MDKKEYNRNWREKNAERVKEYHRNWREKNAERKKEYNRNWREKNAEHVNEYHLKWRAEHPEYRMDKKEYHLKWRAEHPEYAKRDLQYKQDKYHNDPAYRGYHLFCTYKCSDIKNNVVPTDLSDYPSQEEVNEMLLQPCVFCGESDWHKIGLDRKDNRFGHIRGNIQPCCMRCNKKKGKLSNEEFRQAIDDGRIKLKAVKVVKAEACDRAVPAMPTMWSLLV